MFTLPLVGQGKGHLVNVALHPFPNIVFISLPVILWMFQNHPVHCPNQNEYEIKWLSLASQADRD